MTAPIEYIYDTPDEGNGMDLLAIVVRANYQTDHTAFFTDPELPLQVGCIHHRAGHLVQPHTHLRASRESKYTQEVLVVRTGMLKVTLYDARNREVCSRILYRGDLILLASGGHSIEFVQDAWLFEVKLGPYDPNDKVKI